MCLHIKLCINSPITNMEDKLAKNILRIIDSSNTPLETKEIEQKVKATRVKVLYRLNLLRGEGKIKGKFVGPGKGVWIWWPIKAFKGVQNG